MAKQYISAQQLLDDAFRLAIQVFQSNYQPTFIVAVWRGGTPVGIAVQELLAYLGITCDHMAIGSSFYTGIERTAKSVSVRGLEYLIENINADDRLLLVDDVFDSGRSMDQIIKTIGEQVQGDLPELKIATPYFKPENNMTDRKPDFYLHETADWLVFPHELEGLDKDEILQNKPGTEALKQILNQE